MNHLVFAFGLTVGLAVLLLEPTRSIINVPWPLQVILTALVVLFAIFLAAGYELLIKRKHERKERARLTDVAASLTPEEWRELLKFEGRETATLDLDSSEAPVRSLMRKHLIGLPYPYLANLSFAPKSLTQDGFRIVTEGIRPR